MGLRTGMGEKKGKRNPVPIPPLSQSELNLSLVMMKNSTELVRLRVCRHIYIRGYQHKQWV